MKKTKLERFMRDNREEFDSYEPPVNLWSKIDAGLPPVLNEAEPAKVIALSGSPKKLSVWRQRRWQIAAGIVMLLGCFSVYFLTGRNDNNTDKIVTEINPAYGQRVYQYASLIETKRDELRQLEAQDPALYKEFSEEIEKLNADYQNLEAELPQTPNQEDLVKAMIQNLQVQLDILNQQLQIIQKIKQAKQNHGKDMQNV